MKSLQFSGLRKYKCVFLCKLYCCGVQCQCQGCQAEMYKLCRVLQKIMPNYATNY